MKPLQPPNCSCQKSGTRANREDDGRGESGMREGLRARPSRNPSPDCSNPIFPQVGREPSAEFAIAPALSFAAPMPNRLAAEQSPYLRQHAGNPVDWRPWGEEAFARARAEQKPIFLSIGYSTCHWCHVMAHESFENPDVAAVLNRDFVPVKLDRA